MRYLLAAFIAAAAIQTLPALAEPPNDGEAAGDRPRREEFRERMLKEFDEDGDGKLSDEERQKARETMRERFGRRGPDGGRGPEGGPRPKAGKGQKGDRGPDGPRGFRGPGGPEGGPPPQILDLLFERFDEDQNDALSRDEFGKLAEFVRRHRPGGPGGPPPGPRFGGRGFDGPPPGGEDFRRHHRPDGPPGRPPRPPRGERHGDENPNPPHGPENPPGPPPNPEGNADEAI